VHRAESSHRTPLKRPCLCSGQNPKVATEFPTSWPARGDSVRAMSGGRCTPLDHRTQSIRRARRVSPQAPNALPLPGAAANFVRFFFPGEVESLPDHTAS